MRICIKLLPAWNIVQNNHSAITASFIIKFTLKVNGTTRIIAKILVSGIMSSILILHYMMVVGSLKNAPQRYQVRITRTYKYYLIWKRVIICVMKLRILWWEDNLRLSGWTVNVITNVFFITHRKRDILYTQRGQGNVKMETKIRVMQPQVKESWQPIENKSRNI